MDRQEPTRRHREGVVIAAQGRRVRIVDVARRAGVSPGLVSRMLNDDTSLRLRDDTRAAVLEAVEELGYVPHSSARALRQARSRAIGLVLTDVTSPMFTELVAEAQRAATAADYVLVLVDAGEVETRSDSVRAMVASGRLDGLLVQGGYGPGDEVVAELARSMTSVVVNSPAPPGVSSVRLQDQEATRLATHHLLQLGHRDLAFVAGPTSMSSDRRRTTFLDEARAAGAAAAVVDGGWTAQASHDAVLAQEWRGHHPTGVVVVNSGAAVGVLSALATRGLRVPDDVSVIAVHDTWFAPHLSPPLTVVRLPLPDLGRVAVETLIARLDGAGARDMTISTPPPEIVLRASTSSSS